MLNEFLKNSKKFPSSFKKTKNILFGSIEKQDLDIIFNALKENQFIDNNIKLFFKILIAFILLSTKVADLAPLLKASIPKVPTPQKRSRTFLFSKLFNESNKDFFTLD